MQVFDIQTIIMESKRLGFHSFGITSDFIPHYKDYFIQWIQNQKYGDMKWMTKNLDKRLNPSLILEDTKSAIVLGISYHHDINCHGEFKMARYSFGLDYHVWLKERLDCLANFIKENIYSELKWKSFVDTGPILERDLAMKAGLGWIGKNTCLISKEYGSYIFLGVILSNLEQKLENTVLDGCGKCCRCEKACPTKALSDYRLDPEKCLAYHNIEKRGERVAEYHSFFKDNLIGCDICQDVCPWNQNKKWTDNNDWLESFDQFQINSFRDILSMDRLDYKKKYGVSAISRIKYSDFMRNVFIVLSNLKKKDLLSDMNTWKKENQDIKLAECDECIRRLTELNHSIAPDHTKID